MTEVRDWNAKIIEEFRANEGRVGGPFEGSPVLLLHTTGAKSGRERVNPMMYLDLDGQRYVFASKAGADTNPDWYHNLVALASKSAPRPTKPWPLPLLATTGIASSRNRLADMPVSLSTPRRQRESFPWLNSGGTSSAGFLPSFTRRDPTVVL